MVRKYPGVEYANAGDEKVLPCGFSTNEILVMKDACAKVDGNTMINNEQLLPVQQVLIRIKESILVSSKRKGIRIYESENDFITFGRCHTMGNPG